MSLTQLIFRHLAAVLLGAAACTVCAQEFHSEHGLLRVTTVARGLENPWALAFLPDGRMLVTERPGRMRVIALFLIVTSPPAEYSISLFRNRATVVLAPASPVRDWGPAVLKR